METFLNIFIPLIIIDILFGILYFILELIFIKCDKTLRKYDLELKFEKQLEEIKSDIFNYMSVLLKDITNKENILIIIKSLEELNKKEPDKQKWASGKYIYLNDKSLEFRCRVIYHDILKSKREVYCTDKILHTDEKEYFYPRIELSEQNRDDIWFYSTWMHELGHHFIQKRGDEQSEIDADKYIIEFFDTKLPLFYKYYFRHFLSVYCNKCKISNVEVDIKEAIKSFKEFKTQLI